MARTKNSKFQDTGSENFSGTKRSQNSKILKNSKFDYLKQLREDRARKEEMGKDEKKPIPLDDLLYLNHDFDDREAFIKSQQPGIIKTYTKKSSTLSDSDQFLLRTQSDIQSRTSKSRKGEDIIKRNIKNLKKLKPINKDKLKRPKSYKGFERKQKKRRKRKKVKEHLYKYSNPLERELTGFIEDDCELMMSYSVLDDVEDPDAEDDPRKLVKPRVIDPLQKSDLFWKMQNSIKKVYSRGIVSDFEQSMKDLNREDMSLMGDTRNNLASMSSLRRTKKSRKRRQVEAPQEPEAVYEKEIRHIDYEDNAVRVANETYAIQENEEGEEDIGNVGQEQQQPDRYKYNFEVIDEFEDEGSVNAGRDTQGRFKVPEGEKTHGNGFGFAYDSKADTYYKVKTKGSFGYKGQGGSTDQKNTSNSRFINIEVNQNLDNFSETVKSSMNPFAPFDSKYTDLNKVEDGIRRTNPKEEYLMQRKKNQPRANLKIKEEHTSSNNSTSRNQSHQNSYASNFSKRKNAAFRSANSSTISQKSSKKRFKRKAHKMPRYMNEKGPNDEEEDVEDLAASNVASEKDFIVVESTSKKGKRNSKIGNPGTLKVNPNVNLKDLFS